MRAKWPLLATFISLGFGYVAYPYVTLYRLDVAIQGSEAGPLESLVDWPSVREGIKEDMCDMVVAEPDSKAGGQLPPFGASFVRGIATNTIDQRVTPQAILAATAIMPDRKPKAENSKSDVHVAWAFFDSPTVFSVSLQARGLAEPIRLEMKLRHGQWRVDRVWLPDQLLGQTPART